MLTWLRNLFGRKAEAPPARGVIPPENVEHDDPMARDVIARCFNTGKTVFGNRNDDGTVDIHEADD